jgi:hypothetical protein
MHTRSSKRSRVASIASRLKSGLSTMSKKFKKTKGSNTRKRKGSATNENQAVMSPIRTLNENHSGMNARRPATNENQAVMSPIGALNVHTSLMNARRAALSENHSGMNPNRSLSEEEEEEEDQEFRLINSNQVSNVVVNLEGLDLAGVNENDYTNVNALSMHNFREDPPLNQVLGSGISKTVWSNGLHAIVNATQKQRPSRENAKEEFNFTKILRSKFDFFPNVSQIPHLVGKKFKKFVYFSEMAKKVPLTTREEGKNYLTHANQMFKTLYDSDDEYFMLLLDIKPENFGIVKRDGHDTLIWLDIDTQCIMAVRKIPEERDFYIKYQQLLLLLTFLYTSCEGKEVLCTEFAIKNGITKNDLTSALSYLSYSKEAKQQKDRELAGFHQRFLLSCGLDRSANDTAAALYYGYLTSPPFHLIFYLGSNYDYFNSALPHHWMSGNYVPKNT